MALSTHMMGSPRWTVNLLADYRLEWEPSLLGKENGEDAWELTHLWPHTCSG